MLDRIASSAGILSAAIAVLLVCLLGSDAALASVKCQCNNGTVTQNMSSDYDDDDVDAACNDACSSMGGGRVWSADQDDDEDGDITVRPRSRDPKRATPRR